LILFWSSKSSTPLTDTLTRRLFTIPLLDLNKITSGLSKPWSGYLRDWDRSLRSGNYPETTRYNYLLAAAQLAAYLGEHSPDPDAEDPTEVERVSEAKTQNRRSSTMMACGVRVRRQGLEARTRSLRAGRSTSQAMPNDAAQCRFTHHHQLRSSRNVGLCRVVPVFSGMARGRACAGSVDLVRCWGRVVAITAEAPMVHG
jgi:hypothetical protein